MDIAAFDFALPPDRIAQHPARPRDAARLLAIGEQRRDRLVRDLPSLLHPGDVLVANDTRVIPAQLAARRGAARIGITLDRPSPDGTWHALARNARRLRVGDTLNFDGGFERDRAERATRTAAWRWRSTASAPNSPPHCTRPAGSRCRLTSPAPPGRATGRARLPDRVRPPRRRRGGADGLAASDRRAARRAGRAGVERCPSPCMSVPAPSSPSSGDDVARAPDARRKLRGPRGRSRAISAARAARRAGGRGRHHLLRLWRVPWLRTARCGPFAGETRCSSPRLPLPGRRSAADQLPSAALHAVHAGLRLRRHRTRCRGVRPRDRAGLSLLLLRRRLPAGPGALERLRFHASLATDGAARAGVLDTAHGEVETRPSCRSAPPATVKAMTSTRCAPPAPSIVLGNTYHLMLRPGAERIARLGGLHRFMDWPGPILTDSGGFQVMSLAKLRKLDEDGVTFQLAPRRIRASADAGALGRDPAPAGCHDHHGAGRVHAVPGHADEARASMELSMRWAERSQGGVRAAPRLRRCSASSRAASIRSCARLRARAAADRLRRLSRSAGWRSARARRRCSRCWTRPCRICRRTRRAT